MKRRGFMASGFAALSVCTARPDHSQPAALPAQPPKPVKPANRAEATAIIADARKIVTPDGIERLEKVRIGGVDQWVSIRGADRRNPVLLYIHGGPGYVSLPMSWWFSRGWEEYFTVVQWDQRAAGKTHLLTDRGKIAPTLTLDRYVADVVEIVAWVRKELAKEKIFALGHSWGSYLGVELAQHHADKLHAYIGVGQLADGLESERRGWRFAVAAARHDNNSQAVRELESIAPYAVDGGALPIKDILIQRKWLGVYGGVMAYRQNNAPEGNLAQLSPDYSDEEIQHVWDGNEFATPFVLSKVLSLDLSRVQALATPFILFLGRHDLNVNANVSAEWFAKVKAPEKQLVWFEHSAHLPMTEEPGKFLLSLVRYARPIAERAGDVAA